MPDRFAARGLSSRSPSASSRCCGGAPSRVAGAEPAGYEYFHTYAEMEAAIDKVVADHPNLARKFSIGQSYEGREIWGCQADGQRRRSTKGKPEVLINGLMHARERASSELAIYMLQVLANNYGLSGSSANKVTSILNTTVVWVIPMMNPDGAEFDFSGGRFHSWRKNRQPTPDPEYVGIDLNRQFGYTWNCCGGSSGKPRSKNYRGWAPEVAPEVQAYEGFIESRRDRTVEQRITEILSLHSAAPAGPVAVLLHDVRTCPSDMTRDDHKAFVALGQGHRQAQRLQAAAGQRPVHRRRRPGRLGVRDAGDLRHHDRDEEGQPEALLPIAERAQRRSQPQPQRRAVVPQAGRLPVSRRRARAEVLRRDVDAVSSTRSRSTTRGLSSHSRRTAGARSLRRERCSPTSTPSFSASQSDLNDLHDAERQERLDRPRLQAATSAAHAARPAPAYAHDGRGMAWALWNYATPDQSLGFNDYRSTSRGEHELERRAWHPRHRPASRRHRRRWRSRDPRRWLPDSTRPAR